MGDLLTGDLLPDDDPWADSDNKERVKQLKEASLPVFDYLGGVTKRQKGRPHKLKVGVHMVQRGPDALAFAEAQGRPMTPDDCVMEGSEFCTLDLLQHWGQSLWAEEAKGGSGSGISRSGKAHLPCHKCKKWSLCSDGPDRSNVRLVPSERGLLFVLPYTLRCTSCNGECRLGASSRLCVA